MSDLFGMVTEVYEGEPADGGPIGRNAVCVDKKHVALALWCLASAGNLNGVVDRRYEPTVTAHILLDESHPIVIGGHHHGNYLAGASCI